MKIGFIGTGTMGQPMVRNLIAKGFGVVAYDIVPAAVDAAVKLGATACGSAADAARWSIPSGRPEALPVLARGVSEHARGL